MKEYRPRLSYADVCMCCDDKTGIPNRYLCSSCYKLSNNTPVKIIKHICSCSCGKCNTGEIVYDEELMNK